MVPGSATKQLVFPALRVAELLEHYRLPLGCLFKTDWLAFLCIQLCVSSGKGQPYLILRRARALSIQAPRDPKTSHQHAVDIKYHYTRMP
jgi:hypothetical protein